LQSRAAKPARRPPAGDAGGPRPLPAAGRLHHRHLFPERLLRLSARDDRASDPESGDPVAARVVVGAVARRGVGLLTVWAPLLVLTAAGAAPPPVPVQ